MYKNMKKLLLIPLLFLSFLAYSQIDTTIITHGVRQYNRTKGFDWNEGAFNLVLRPPQNTFQLLPKDSGAIAWRQGLKVWNGYSWESIGGSAGGGTSQYPGLGLYKSVGAIDTIKTTSPYIGQASGLRNVFQPVTTNTYSALVNGYLRTFRYYPGDTTPDDSVMTFSSAVGRYKMDFDYYIDAGWFGFSPNTGTNQTSYIQKAVNYAINAKTKRLVISSVGEYQVNKLVCAVKSGANYSQFALTIEGAVTSLGLGVTFYNTDVNAATILIQKGKGIEIKNIDFKGVGADIDLGYITAGDAQWTTASTSGTIRSNRKSPGQTAIAIDPFKAVGAFNSTITSSADMYPGLSSWYTNTDYSGSTNVNIEGCTIERMYVGIAEGLSGEANGEGIHVNNMFATNVAYFWAAGQLQSRENTITKLYLTFCQTFLAGQGWGVGNGDVPSVNNSNINYVKQLYDTYGSFTKPRFNMYGEGIYSLGRHTGNSLVTFFNSTIAFAANNLTGVNLGVAPVLAEGAAVTLENTSLLAPSYYAGLPFNVDQVSLKNCYIEGNLPFTTDDTYGQDRISYDNCTWWLNGAVARLSKGRVNRMTNETLFFNRNESFLLPGNQLVALDGRRFTNIGDMYDRLPAHLDQYNTGFAATVNSSSQTLAFTAPEPGIFLVGDLIYTTTAVNSATDIYASSTTTLGHVTAISGTTITLGDIPAGVVNGTYQMWILRLPRFINHTLGGTVTSGSNAITGVIADQGGFSVGDRIKGDGIVDGTYVSLISGSTIYLSTNATASGSLVQLSDAKMEVTGDDVGFKYFGGNYNFDNLEVIWFRGDRLRNLTYGNASYGRYCIAQGKVLSGNPPTWYSGGIPDPLTVSRIQTGNTSYTLSIQGGVGNDGATIQAMGATHSSLPGNIYLNIGSLDRPIAATASLHVRAFNNSLAPDLFSIDKDGNTVINNLAGTGTRMVVASPGGLLSTQAIPGGGGGGGDVYLANSNTFSGVNQTAPKWSTGNSYFYDNGQTHIGNVVGGYNLLFENYGLVQMPGGVFYPSIWDASGSQIISTTARLLGVAGSGNRFLTTNNNGDVGAALIDTTNIANFYTKVRSLFTAGTGVTIVNGVITATGGGGGAGTVTSVSASMPSGFSVSVSNATTTPAINVTTALNGLILGNGSGLSALVYGANGTILKMVAGVPAFVTDSADLVIDATLRDPGGVLGVAPEAYTVLNKSTTITTSSYTVADGIFTVVCNYGGGTLTVTLPNASTHADARITIKNISANNVTVTPVRSGDATTQVTNDAVTYQAIGGVWMAISRY